MNEVIRRLQVVLYTLWILLGCVMIVVYLFEGEIKFEFLSLVYVLVWFLPIAVSWVLIRLVAWIIAGFFDR
jgi:hypothetical protein